MNKLTHDQIAELVVKAQQGDQEAFAGLYAATVDRQLYFATGFLKDPILAEDVVQDVYLKMFKAINKLKEPRTFVAYLNRICYNTCVDYKKKHYTEMFQLDNDRVMRKADDSTDSAPEDYLELKDTNTAIYGALSQLEEDQRTAFMLRFYNDYKIREIADSMELSESTVKRYIKTATDLLKESLSHTMMEERG